MRLSVTAITTAVIFGLHAPVARSQQRSVNADPDSARIITSDIPLFWAVLDAAPPDSLAAWLQREYLDKASAGVRGFIPGRIMNAGALAQMVMQRRARYDSVRAATFRVDSAVPAIRAVFRRFKELYPEAVFPDVYFVIGRFNSGGTTSNAGLLIGAEMYRDYRSLPGIVAHELIHYQQRYISMVLLYHAFKEGSASFVAHLISGVPQEGAAHRYGLPRERELWQEFLAEADSAGTRGWMYGDPPGERPPDLGYFIGYRIAEAYYSQAADKAQALRDIINPPGGNVRRLLEASGYNP
jgi:hypothetical protein